MRTGTIVSYLNGFVAAFLGDIFRLLVELFGVISESFVLSPRSNEIIRLKQGQ